MKKRILLPCMAMLLLMASCKIFHPVQFVPAKDAAMVPAIELVAKITDSAFKSTDLSYAALEPRYAVVSYKIDSIYTVDIVRLRSNNIVSMVGKTRNIFNEIVKEHKTAGVLKERQAYIDNLQLQAAYNALITAEKQLK